MTKKICFLSGNMLKILAAIFMTIDHIGVLLFSDVLWLRVVGRLAYPIFAFMIAEGAKYTRNKARYLGLIAGLALICQIVYFLFDNGSLYMCILVTFSLSIMLIYAMQYMKKVMFDNESGLLPRITSVFAFITALTVVYILNKLFVIDYGFFGCIAPLFAALFDFCGINAPEALKRLDNLHVHVGTFGIALLLLAIGSVPIQYFSLASLVLLLLYSGKRGKYKMKYFFYLFYPLHLVALEGIYLLVYYL